MTEELKKKLLDFSNSREPFLTHNHMYTADIGDGSAAVVETVPLRLPAGDSLHPDAQLLEKIRFFGADDKTESAAALLARLAAGDVPSEDELPAGSRAELLA